MDLTEDRSRARFSPVGFVEGPSAQRLKIGYAADAPGVLDEIAGRFEETFADVDLIMGPVSPLIGIQYSEFSADKSFDLERANLDVAPLKFTGPVNFAGNPAMSVPLSWDVKDGLPAGTHFIAGIGRERTLYELAYELEAAYPWRDIWAPHSLKHL